MNLDKELLKQCQNDPSKVMRVFIDHVEKATDGQVILTDATNPFVMQLECNSVNTSVKIEEIELELRRHYTSMLTEEKHIHKHYSDEEEINMFATPSKAKILFMLKLSDVRDFGLVEGDSKKMSIPKYTSISVSNIEFTLLNEINVYYRNNESFVEQMNSEEVGSINNLGNLRSTIWEDENKVHWILFETDIYQISRTELIDDVTIGLSFQRSIPISDQYYHSEVYIRTNNESEWIKLNKTHSDVMFNLETPTIHVTVLENELIFTIPTPYLSEGIIVGEIKIVVYTTKGEISIPLNKYSLGEFKITLGDPNDNIFSSIASEVTMIASSRYHLDGGHNLQTIEETKNKVIFNTTGLNEIPITEYELEEKARLNGFSFYKALDVVTDRVYILSKNTVPDINHPIKLDFFNLRTSVILSNLTNDKFILNTNKNLVIKSGTLIRENNGVCSILTEEEYNSFMSNIYVIKKEMLFENNYFYTPYYYVIDTQDSDLVKSRIYDLDNPTVSNKTIANKNVYETLNVNIESYDIVKILGGYRLRYTLIGLDSADKQLNEFGIQVRIDINGSGNYVHFHSEYEEENELYYVDILTDYFVSENDMLNISNGISNLYNIEIALNTNIDVITYVKRTSDSMNKYEPNKLLMFSEPTVATALSMETFDVHFGDKLEYLWNYVELGYTDRKYATYHSDIYLKHIEDVYVLDDDGDEFKLIDTNNDGVYDDVEFTFLHKKGDIVLDDNGDPTVLHKKGDIVLDSDGNGVINELSGIVRRIDILGIPLEFQLSDMVNEEFIKYYLDIMSKWLLVDMVEINKNLLENTNIYLKPFKTTLNVPYNTNHIGFQFPVVPTVKLYVDNNDLYDSEVKSNLNNIIGLIVSAHLDKKEFSLEDIKKDIYIRLKDYVLAVGISDVSPDNAEVVNIKDLAMRPALKIRYDKPKLNYGINIEIIDVD